MHAARLGSEFARPPTATTNGFHLGTTDLYTAIFRHDWGMLLCTIAVLMTRRSGERVDSPARIERVPSHGSHCGHMVPRARDGILDGATDELKETIAAGAVMSRKGSSEAAGKKMVWERTQRGLCPFVKSFLYYFSSLFLSFFVVALL